MAELREPLDSLIAPRSHTAGITIHDRLGLDEQDLLAYALMLGRKETA